MGRGTIPDRLLNPRTVTSLVRVDCNCPRERFNWTGITSWVRHNEGCPLADHPHTEDGNR